MRESDRFLMKLESTYDSSWLGPIFYEYGGRWIPFKGMIDNVYLTAGVEDFQEEPIIILTLVDESEDLVQEETFSDADEACYVLDTWIENCVSYGYFRRFNKNV